MKEETKDLLSGLALILFASIVVLLTLKTLHSLWS